MMKRGPTAGWRECFPCPKRHTSKNKQQFDDTIVTTVINAKKTAFFNRVNSEVRS